MLQKLSIIIPCYNCATTLREAVESCYAQDLSSDEFEIIMVDDGSKDSTRELMEVLASAYSNIRLLYHEINKGGGAARNNGISNSDGELIYCLDSDNIFSPHSLKVMISYLEKMGADGVAFYERRFFYGRNKKDFRIQQNNVLNKPISLKDLFTEAEPLLDNFMYTRTAYNKTLGYPEHHGFDTQCFEMRFITSGNKVYICPGTIFYHRQGMKERSYFERVHASGMFSVNSMLIYEEIFHLFQPKIQKELVGFPIFSENSSTGNNVNAYLRNQVISRENIFVDNVSDYVISGGLKKWNQEANNQNESNVLPQIIAAVVLNNFTIAHAKIGSYISLMRNEVIPPYLAFLELRILQGLSGVPTNKIISSTFAGITLLQIKNINSSRGLIGILLRKNSILRYLKNKIRYYQNDKKH